MRPNGLLLLASMAVVPSHGAILYLADRGVFVLETANSSYVLGVNREKQVQFMHWGGLLADGDLRAPRQAPGFAFESGEGLTPEEYPGFGGMRYSEPCLKVRFPNGTSDLAPRYASHEIAGETMRLRLADIREPVSITLVYEVFPQEDIIRRHAVIANGTKAPLLVENAQSGVWHLPPGGDYRLTYLAGRWAGETQLTRQAIPPGKLVLESRRGNTSHQMHPWFAIDGGERATEEHGEVWFGALAWSGNWKIAVERTPQQQTRVSGGMNDFDFAWRLAPGESLETPGFIGGYTSGGFGEASRLLHRFERNRVLPDRSRGRLRPVLYNSWEATEFHVNEDGQKALADRAARIGAELFVMDDGWFGARDHDRAGLGDWFVNRKKFPNGLKALIDHVKSRGMAFGLWVEPEMVNPDSDLYRAHPDWVIHYENRPRTEGRNQLILNMARPDVKEHIYTVLDKLLAENSIDFIKWDMNRHITEPGWPAAGADAQQRLYVEYVRNVYGIIDRLRARHPTLEIESCSGGGGRADLGILARVEQVWTSDNTEAFDRLRIQEGFSFAHTPKVMMDWVTDVPNMNGRSTPLDFRFHVAMMGSLGIGGDLNKWSEAEMAAAARWVAVYKRIRKTVQEGALYRLLSPREGALTANNYVSGDGRQAVLFVMLEHQQFRQPAPAVRLRGLEPGASYRLETVDKKLPGAPASWSGAYLMRHGLRFDLRGDYDSTLVILERER